MSITLRTGDLNFEVTDLKINTPVGPLAFTRTYRQDKVLVANQARLGRGWSHNHHIRLKAIGSPVEELEVLTAGHGLLRFMKSGTNTFDAAAGSTTTITYDSGNDEYSMVAQDKSVYLFDLDPDTSLGAGDFTYRLISRTWENGDVWTYSYNDTGGSPTYRLTDVEDSRYTIDGSTHRSLTFTYNGSGLLDRVTDHTGRYVEFQTYVADKEPNGSGGVQNGSSYVLTEVQDVRGEVWQYDYYGQSSGETNEYLLNRIIKRLAPPTDLSGDGMAEDELTLEQLDFVLPTNEIVNGNMEITLSWSTVGTPTNASQSSVEADNGDHAWYVDADAAGEGIESNSWDMNANRTYIATARVKVVSGVVKMTVSGGASGFEVDSTTTDEWETLTTVYSTSSATTGHKLQFLSKDNPAEFYVDNVQVVEDLIADRDMESSGGWSAVNGAIHNQYPQDQYIYADSAVRHISGAAAGDGVRSDAVWNMTNGKTYAITAQVYVVSGTVKMTVNGTTQLDDVSSGTGSWEPLSASYPATATTTGHYLQFLAEGGPAEFYLDNVTITEDSADLITDGDMESDSGWSAVANGVQAQYPQFRQIYDGAYSWEVVAAAAGEGIQSNSWDLVADQAYLAAAWVYVLSGTVKLSVSGVSGFAAVSTGTGRWERLAAVYVPGSGSSNHTLQFLAEDGAAEFYVDEASVQVTPLITRTLGIDPSTWGEDLTEAMVTQFIIDPTHHSRTHTHERLLGSDGSTYYTTLHQFDNGVLTGSQNPLGQGGQRQQTNRYRDFLRQDANGNASRLSWNQDLLDNGDMEEAAAWAAVGTFTNNPEQSTGQVYSGRYAWFVDSADAEEGIQSSSFTLRQDQSYYLEAQVYATSGTVKLVLWDGSSVIDTLVDTNAVTGEWVHLRTWYTPTADVDTAYLRILADTGGATFYVDAVRVQQENGDQVTRVVDAAGNATEFAYDSQERLLFSIDAEGRKTRYKYNDTVNPQQPSEIIVLEPDGTVLQWQYFKRTYDVNDLLTSVEDRVLDPADYDDTPGDADVLRETERIYYSVGNGAGLLKGVTQDDRTTTYLYDALGRVVQTNQNSTFGSCTRSRTVYDAADNVVASICNFDFDPSGTPSANSEVTDHEAEYAFDEDPTTYWQASGISGEWLEFDFGSGNAQTLTQIHLTARDTAADVDEMPKDFDIRAFNGSSWDTLSSVSGETGWQAGETRTFSFSSGTAYQRWRIYVSAVDGGSQVSLAEFRLRSLPIDAASAEALYDDNFPDKNRVTTYAYDARGLQVETTLSAGSSTNERINKTAYDGLGRVVRTISNYNAGGAPTDPYIAARSGFSHGSDGSQNRVSDTAFNAHGLVWKTVDTRDRATLYGYDAAGRQIKVIQNASNPSYNTAADPDLSGYTASGQSGEDLITASAYDAAGNLVQQTDVLGFDDFTVYDSLNRVVKTVRRAKAGVRIDLNPGDTGYDATLDPRSALYAPSTEPDRDLIALTEYDSMGRVIRSRDEIGNWTLFGYDGLGRQVRTIASASQPFYNIASDPGLSAYVVSNEADEDILSETVYASSGQVQYTADVNGLETWFAYDGSGRQVKTAVNFTGSAGQLENWEWANNQWEDGSSNPISHGAGNDENILSQTVYDTEGRVESTRDVLGRVTRQVYDEQGRRTLTIRNYVGNGIDPSYWFWDDTNTQWEYDDGMSSSGVISHGTDGDENIISQTIYDSQGRVDITRDHRGNLTKSVFDASGRLDKTIQNYVANSQDPLDWEWVTSQWEDGNSTAIEHGTDKDQNLISQTSYDSEGRVDTVRDSAGRLTKFVYDAVGRREKVIRNYVANSQDPLNWEWANNRWEDGLGNAIDHGSNNDQNLISQTIYSSTGQVAATRDTRGTKTAFVYDAARRRVQVTAAADTSLATVHYTVYDKAGRVQRTIANCTYDELEDDPPHAKDNNGNWLYDPADHGPLNDRDLITERLLDKRGRLVQRSDPAGASYQTTYAKDGRVVASTDPEAVVQRSVYDQLRRLTRVVANYQDTGGIDPDPAHWEWLNNQWEDGSGTLGNPGNLIDHDPDADGNADTNIIAEVTLDVVGRQLTLRDPRGNLTAYTYDQLNRRLSMQDALDNIWAMAYIDAAVDLDPGQSRVELTNPLSQVVQRNFDRAGRLQAITYLSESPKLTPDVSFGYDVQGNRTLMSENDGSLVRESYFTYDQAARLVTVDLDTDGDTTIDETLNYEYDLAGQRTKLILPGGTEAITYQYDTKGRLIAVSDWDLGASQFAYDNVDRLMFEERSNGLASRYRYDESGRLRALSHLDAHDVLAQFTFEVDERGNRTLSREALLHPGTGQTTIASADDAVAYDGTWTTSGAFQETTQVGAELEVTVMGDSIDLTLGNGTDHGICDIYVNGVFWGSRDTYSATATEETVTIELDTNGPHVLHIRNTGDEHLDASGHKLRFKQVVLPVEYDLHTVQYTYDAMSRLLGAHYFAGENLNATAFRKHDFIYDESGNRLNHKINLIGQSEVINAYDYNVINAIISETIDGGTPQSFSYDDAGRLTDDGTLTYAWDRADRLLTTNDGVTTVNYEYNGLGQRVKQDTTEYLLDTVQGLPRVITDKTGSVVNRYVFSDHGLLRHQQPDSSWVHPLRDGLGSVRHIVDASLDPVYSVNHTPYGELWNAQGTSPMPFGFTGEWQDPNDLLFLRARYYNPAQAAFLSLDPIEGGLGNVTTLNRYGYVAANPANLVDPSGLLFETPPIGCGSSGSGGFLRQGSPSCVNLGSGSVQLGATQTLFDNMFVKSGLLLTAECGYTGSKTWDDFENDLNEIHRLINSRFKKTTDWSFLDTFYRTEFRIVTEGVDPKASAFTRSSVRIDWNPNNMIPGPVFQEIVIHELGHVLDHRVDEDLTNWVGEYNFNTLAMTKAQRGNDPELNPDSFEEWAADHFLNWVYNSYGQVDPIVDDFLAMKSDSPDIQSLNLDTRFSGDTTKTVLGYWLGNKTFTLSISGLQPASPGIQGWLDIASRPVHISL